jgi:hypothetical protein
MGARVAVTMLARMARPRVKQLQLSIALPHIVRVPHRASARKYFTTLKYFQHSLAHLPSQACPSQGIKAVNLVVDLSKPSMYRLVMSWARPGAVSAPGPNWLRAARSGGATDQVRSAPPGQKRCAGQPHGAACRHRLLGKAIRGATHAGAPRLVRSEVGQTSGPPCVHRRLVALLVVCWVASTCTVVGWDG